MLQFKVHLQHGEGETGVEDLRNKWQ